MSWIANTVPRQICQFLLNRYLGEILLEKVNIEQLSVDLIEGTGSINEVYLDVEGNTVTFFDQQWRVLQAVTQHTMVTMKRSSEHFGRQKSDNFPGATCLNKKEDQQQRINQALKKCDLPFELVEGFVGSITVKIPYSKVLNDSCNIEIDGLELTCQPRPKYQSVDLVASMIESVIGSMTTSVDLARSFVEENKNNDIDQKLQGIDTLAQLIQIILSRMKVNVNKIIIRLEYSEGIDAKATAVEVRIDRIAYVDETIDVKTPSNYPVTEQPQSCSNNNAAPGLSSASNEFVKLFRFSGISFYTDIFNKPAESRSSTMFSESKFYRNEDSTHPDSLQSDNLFKSTMSSHSVYHSLYMSSPSSSNDHSEFTYSAASNLRDSVYRNTDYSPLREDSPHQSPTSSNPVKFAECISDSLLLRMKFKNRKSDDENLIGKGGTAGFNAKVEIDFALGSLNVFLTPSQLKILARIAHGLLYQESSKSDSPNKPAGGKPMADDDYLKVETELRRKMDENRNPSFATRLNVSDLVSRGTETGRDFSLNEIKLGSSRRSCKSQSAASCTIPFTDDNLNNNSCRIHWNNVCVILTHDDPVTLNHDLSPSKLISGWTSSFFQIGQKIDSLKVGNLGKLRSLFHSSYKDDHLQFLATPLEFQWTWDNAAGTDIVFIAKKTEILEYLHKTENHELKQEPNIVEVLRFASSSKETEEESDIIVSYCTKHNQGHRLQFDLKKCRILVDLTIVDRLSNLLFHSGPFSRQSTDNKLSLKDKYLFDVPEANEYKDFDSHLMESFSEKIFQPNSCNFELSCPNLLLELSFPIPLLSPSNFLNNKFAWQLRRVRNERLNFEFQTVSHGDSGDSNLASLERSCFKPPGTCEGPFHRKHVAHENEQLIMVGNKTEIKEFRRECEKQIALRLEIRLQTVRLHLPSKSFYELLYNSIHFLAKKLKRWMYLSMHIDMCVETYKVAMVI
uniref:Autophagy-related protein 2 n=1 Tax=Romanomermis culicivorax TaxID=13658 RepID=A0A915IG90_ROMCU